MRTFLAPRPLLALAAAAVAFLPDGARAFTLPLCLTYSFAQGDPS